MSETIQHNYPKPDYPLDSWGLHIRNLSPSYEQFDLMYRQCKTWQAARAKNNSELIAFPYSRLTPNKDKGKPRIERGLVGCAALWRSAVLKSITVAPSLPRAILAKAA